MSTTKYTKRNTLNSAFHYFGLENPYQDTSMLPEPQHTSPLCCRRTHTQTGPDCGARVITVLNISNLTHSTQVYKVFKCK